MRYGRPASYGYTPSAQCVVGLYPCSGRSSWSAVSKHDVREICWCAAFFLSFLTSDDSGVVTGGNCPPPLNFGLSENCGNIFLVGEFSSKMRNLGPKAPYLGDIFGAKLIFWAPIISCVGNLQLSVGGKLQLLVAPTSLTHDAPLSGDIVILWPVELTIVRPVVPARMNAHINFGFPRLFTRDSRNCYIARLSHRNSVCLSVCPSVRLSHGWIRQKRCKLGSSNLHHRLPQRL